MKIYYLKYIILTREIKIKDEKIKKVKNCVINSTYYYITRLNQREDIQHK